jgi:hypothetical protein
MTTTHPAPQAGHRSSSADGTVHEPSTEVRDYLSPRCFPATRDELQATLVRHHAPAQLLWELASLSPTRRFEDLDKLCTALDGHSRPSLPLEPI